MTNVQQPYKKGTKKVQQSKTKHNKGTTKVHRRYNELRTKDNEGMTNVQQPYKKGTTKV